MASTPTRPIRATSRAARDNLDHACRNFDHRVTAWWRVSHRRVKGGIDGEFASTADARIDAINQANIGSGKYFRNSHSLALAFTPETGISRIFDKIGYHMTVGGKNLAVAMFEAAKDLLLARSAFVFDLTKLQNEIKRFEAVIDGFTGGVTPLENEAPATAERTVVPASASESEHAQAPRALSGHDARHASDGDASHDRRRAS